MKLRSIISIGLFVLASHANAAPRADENIVIADAADEYTFVPSPDGLQVRHTSRTEYLATKHSADVTPHVYYNDVIRLDKASGGKAEYLNINSPAVFHDDSKVCRLNLWLGKAGKKAKAEFRRTFLDPAHFTGVFVQDDYPVRRREIRFRIPASLPGISLTDENFPETGIVREEALEADGSRLISFTVTDQPPFPDDASAPSPLAALPHISVRGYFPDTDSLYRYQARINRVDTVLDGAPELVAAITAGATDRDEIIGKIYDYVRRTIRYVAYEEGEAAFRPDTPSETFRKRYGDCKSMSLLLATLLDRAGVEAHIAAVGTRDIPFLISENPSLSAANHMICIVPGRGDTLFLDPTQEAVSARHIPEWIRGKDAMMFMPDGYRMVRIPAESPLASDDVAEYGYVLTDGALVGRVSRVLREDMAGLLAAEIAAVPAKHKDAYLAKLLVPNGRASIPVDSIRLDESKSGVMRLEAPIANTVAVTEADGCTYLDLNTSGEPFTARVDTTDRRSDYELPFPARVERRTRVALPKGAKVTLPDDFSLSTPNADFNCHFFREGDVVGMVKTMLVKKTRVPLPEIPAWNKALSDWNSACNIQIEIN